MGFQLESLLLTNREFLFKALGLEPANVVCDNPFLQRPTERKKGCQIDYLIEELLALCEEFFNSSILNELMEKSAALSIPRGFGKTVALFHIGGVSPQIEESPLLYRVIDLRDLLEEGA